MASIHLIDIPFEIAEALKKLVDKLANVDITPQEAEEARHRLIEPYLPYAWKQGDGAILNPVRSTIISLPGEATP